MAPASNTRNYGMPPIQWSFSIFKAGVTWSNPDQSL